MTSTTLSNDQWRTLQALVDCLIPRDDFPSGWEAGVGEYLARQFEGDLREVVPMYVLGLDGLDAEAQATLGQPFAALDLKTQTHLLTQIEQGQTKTTWPTNAQSFLTTAMNHAAEGFYSDPGNGGNTDGAAWKMMGYEVKG